MKHFSLAHEFVEFIPGALEEGKLYVSIPYATAVHSCACGCGRKVVTPISPAQWQLTFDGETVSLTPSIGNWQFACRSHYWIRNNKISWAAQWSEDEITAGRLNDQLDVERLYAEREAAAPAATSDVTPGLPQGLFAKLRRWARKRR